MIKPLLFSSLLAGGMLLFSCTKEEEPTSDCEVTVNTFAAEATGYFNYFTAIRADEGSIIVSEGQVNISVNGNFIEVKGITFNLCQMKWYRLDNVGPGRELVIYF
jgi:hypothetical protein